MTTTQQDTSRAILVTAFKWLLAAGMLAGLYWMCGDDLAKLKDRQILWGMLAAALLVRLLSLMATFTRWRLLVRGIGLPFSFRDTFRLGMLGEACNLMGPGAVGGDLVKAGLLAKDHTNRIPSVLATVFLDRVLGMWALFVLGALASLSPAGAHPGPELLWAVRALWCGAVAGLVGIALMFVPAFTHSRLMHWLTTWKFVGRIVKELMESIELYQGNPRVVIGAAALGLLGHFGFLSTFFICALCVNGGQAIPGYIEHIVGLPLPEVFSAAIPTPGGIGTLEGGVGWIYKQHQQTTFPESSKELLATAFSNGVLAALCYRLTSFVWGAVGVVYYLASRNEIRDAVNVVNVEPAEKAA